MGASLPADPLVRRGTARVFFAFEVGQRIDLVRSGERLGAGAAPVPGSFLLVPQPLRLVRPIDPVAVPGFGAAGDVELTLHEFGAISASLAVPLAGPLSGLAALSRRLEDDTTLGDAASAAVAATVASLGVAVVRPHLAAMREDYVLFEIQEWDPPLPPCELVAASAPVVASVLRGETSPLSAQEIADATSSVLSYGLDDAAVIDWRAAVLFDPHPIDVRAALEFANVQLLELRFLDRTLDRALDQAYEVMASRRRLAIKPLSLRLDLRRIGQMQVDGALLYEQVHNALKLVGDPFLARVYRAAAQRLRLGEWNAGIERKLETIDSIYRKVADRQALVRAEVLEWIIIALIAAELVLARR